MNRNRPQWCRPVGLTLAFATIVLSISCSRSNHPELFPVEGQLFLERKPAYKAVIWFCPIGESARASSRPHAVVGDDGNFEVGTYKTGDGAPAGRYKLFVIWRVPPKSGDEDGPSLIPFRYMDPEKSGLPIIEVSAGPTVIPPIRLLKN